MFKQNKRSRIKKLLWLAAGLFVFGIMHDFLQEVVFKQEGFQFGWFMALMELLSFIIPSYAQLRFQKKAELLKDKPWSVRDIPWKLYLPVVVCLTFAQGLGTSALSYVNYPVKVVLKSCKLIPTMILGLTILGRHYKKMEYAAAFGVCLGTAGFILADSAVSPKATTFGVFLLVLAVVADALTVNLQEKSLKSKGRPKSEMMFASNFMAAVFTFIYTLVTGEFNKAVAYCYNHPRVFALLCIQASLMYLSVRNYIAVIQTFGGNVAVTMTSCRKVVTIVISFVAFSKPATWSHAFFGFLTLFAAFLSVIFKGGEQKTKRAKRRNKASLRV